jgi:uncharacterized protein YigE (DUF2233 family)
MKKNCRTSCLVAAAGVVVFVVTAQAADQSCRNEQFRSASYTVCSFDLKVDDVRVFWQDENGTPFRTFSALAESLDAQGLDLTFAANGGMYQDDLSPVGLLVVEGSEQREANTVNVKGKMVPNFYKKPNGIFFVGNGKAGVLETGAFLKQRPPAEFATQSGPMLVIDGTIHPAFIADSPYLNRRNGVCASSPTEVHLAITDTVVNFDDFARFFRDRLGCENALFLDGGSAPGIYVPERERNDTPGHGGYGPIIGVVKEKP